MSNPSELEIAQRTLLEPAHISEHSLEKILNQVLVNRVDYADLYFQHKSNESWVLEDGIIKEGHFTIDHGVGVRAISGEKTGFAYADEIKLPALENAAQAARLIATEGGQFSLSSLLPKSRSTLLYSRENPIDSLGVDAKINLLRSLDLAAKRIDPRVKQVIVSLGASYDIVLIVGSDGTFNADLRPLVRLNVSVIAEDKGQREQGSCGGGQRGSLDLFLKNDFGLHLAEEAVRLALLNLKAKPAPAGILPVVLGPGWPGVLLHEAVGHGLEGDFNRKKSSAFSGKMGQPVASPLCTVVDDGTLLNRRGSLNIDDEGTPSQCTVLIENGILTGYLQDKHNARLMNSKPTGNGRRESYAHVPMPRMTNTYMRAGNHDPAEIIASVDKGLYAVNFGGGQVDITSGKFVFNASEAYLIEKGKVTTPVKGAMLVGNGPDILKQVSMVGTDLKLDLGVGTCGKEGQSVPVGVGQPTLKIDMLTVGGTQS